MLAEQGAVAIMSPEGDVFEMMAGRYTTSGSPNLYVYLAGHAGDSVRVDRVGRDSESIPQPGADHWVDRAAGGLGTDW